MTEPRYPIVVVEVPEVEADEAGARLFELGALGVEQRDATTLVGSGADGRTVLVASSAASSQRPARNSTLARPPRA